MLAYRRREYITGSNHLPCAGITLFRFYGYNLSRFATAPRELDLTLLELPESRPKGRVQKFFCQI